jgi:hypothetical protein
MNMLNIYYANTCACVAAERHVADCSKHGSRAAQAIEAQRAETTKIDAVEDESAVAESDAPKASQEANARAERKL